MLYKFRIIKGSPNKVWKACRRGNPCSLSNPTPAEPFSLEGTKQEGKQGRMLIMKSKVFIV